MAKAEKVLTPEALAALEEQRRQEQSRERAKRTREKAALGGLWSRRDFLGRLSWSGFGVLGGIGLLAFVRSAFPRVLFTPPSTFKAGLPSDYAVGEISERFKKDHRVWIVRVSDGFYALFAKCTHLGCTPRWLPVEEKFKCPCHGSGFRRSGINFEGPAPRPLERYRIALAEDGQLLVDMSVKYRYEKGDWTKPGAFLKA
ncbi:MAG: Rieske 2Fe-2S domain-containing protein [Deltaproteobacteria bacterium]|nr:Rieske 2Fe-2S domain-containing protein [Deltaproteobacteria bacterium]MBI3389169.1 Rieske 2Fe-2S domain-containing protein [Deltaproteobacteria bacterium]